MVPSKLAIGIAKACADRNNFYFSERLKAFHTAVKAPGHFLLTGWLAGRMTDENLLSSFQNF